MSLKHRGIDEVPEMTVLVAQAAFPKGSLYMRMRDELGTMFEDEDFEALYAIRGQPGLAPWRLALVTVMQFAENLTDRQTAHAIRARIDWKYALGLELTDPGFDYSVLSEFRGRLVGGQAEQVILEKMLAAYEARGLLKGQGQQRTDATHVLGAIRNLNRLELVHETLHHTLNVLAEVAPDWLKAQIMPEWFDRYGERLTTFRLPKDKQEQRELAEVIGTDGTYLLEQVYSSAAPEWLREVQAVGILHHIWVQTFYQTENGVHWREKDEQPPSGRAITSPYDTTARYSSKRGHSWVGYKVHLTETCTDDAPNLITHVETRLATEHDVNALPAIHQSLDDHERLPGEHFVDSGYTSADLIISSQDDYGIELVGPVRPDLSWQARSLDGLDITQFTIDWEQQVAICPQGKRSRRWSHHHDTGGYTKFRIQFSRSDCDTCPDRTRCTRNKTMGRAITVLPQRFFEALHTARQYQETPEFKKRYARRAGVEGTISQAAFTLGLRRSRYRGLAKTHLQHVATAAAINLGRVMNWLAEVPRSTTRKSRFAKLAV